MPAAFLVGLGLVPEEGKPKAPAPFTRLRGQAGWCWAVSSLPGGLEGFHLGGVAASRGGTPGAHLPVHGWGSGERWCFSRGPSWASAAALPQPQPAHSAPAGGNKLLWQFILPCRKVVNCSVTGVQVGLSVTVSTAALQHPWGSSCCCAPSCLPRLYSSTCVLRGSALAFALALALIMF